MYKLLAALIVFLAAYVDGKRHGHAIGFSKKQVDDIQHPSLHHRLSDSEIIESLARDTEDERALLRRTSRTFASLNNKLKSILRDS